MPSVLAPEAAEPAVAAVQPAVDNEAQKEVKQFPDADEVEADDSDSIYGGSDYQSYVRAFSLLQCFPTTS